MVVSNKECGIDLANCTDVDQFGEGYLDHFKDIFHEHEYWYLKSVEDTDELKNTFTHYWALKESYTKKLGIGLNGDLASYNFRNVDKLQCNEEFISTQTVLKVRKIPQWNCKIQLSIYGNDESISIWSSMIDPQIVVSICQAESPNVPKLVEIDLETIVHFFST
jgi:phosphopantetheinyl transferase